MYLAPQNIPCGIVLKLGNKVLLYCIVKEKQVIGINCFEVENHCFNFVLLFVA